MIKFISSFTKKLFMSNFIKYTPQYFSSQFSISPFTQHIVQTTMRNQRRLFLNRSVLNKNKDITYAQLRKHSQGVLALKQLGKCPGVIERLSGKIQQQIDIVLQGKKMKQLSKRQIYPLTPLYVRVEGKQYRCIYYKHDYHPDGFIQKAYLKEYVPGEPNYLKIPIEITHITNNRFIMSRAQAQPSIEQIDVICYNEEYPLKFYIDISYCCPDRPYRVGDLANTLPPGIILGPKVNLNDKILQIQKVEEQVQEEVEDMIIEGQQEVKEQKDKKKDVKPGEPTPTGDAKSEGGKEKTAGKDKGASKGAGETGAKGAAKSSKVETTTAKAGAGAGTGGKAAGGKAGGKSKK